MTFGLVRSEGRPAAAVDAGDADPRIARAVDCGQPGGCGSRAHAREGWAVGWRRAGCSRSARGARRADVVRCEPGMGLAEQCGASRRQWQGRGAVCAQPLRALACPRCRQGSTEARRPRGSGRSSWSARVVTGARGRDAAAVSRSVGCLGLRPTGGDEASAGRSPLK